MIIVSVSTAIICLPLCVCVCLNICACVCVLACVRVLMTVFWLSSRWPMWRRPPAMSWVRTNLCLQRVIARWLPLWMRAWVWESLSKSYLYRWALWTVCLQCYICTIRYFFNCFMFPFNVQMKNLPLLWEIFYRCDIRLLVHFKCWRQENDVDMLKHLLLMTTVLTLLVYFYVPQSCNLPWTFQYTNSCHIVREKIRILPESRRALRNRLKKSLKNYSNDLW